MKPGFPQGAHAALRNPQLRRNLALATTTKRAAVTGERPDWEELRVAAHTDFVTGALDAPALDQVDGALTGCALAIAETGTIVLDGGRCQGGRALSLVPDYHLCIVGERQIVGTVPEAMALIAPTIRRMLRPVTFVSGPSATSDIELSRVEGVHGPRTLDVLVLSEA